MIGNIIQDEYLNDANYPMGAALSFTLMAFLLIGIFVYTSALGVCGAGVGGAGVIRCGA